MSSVYPSGRVQVVFTSGTGRSATSRVDVPVVEDMSHDEDLPTASFSIPRVLADELGLEEFLSRADGHDVWIYQDTDSGTLCLWLERCTFQLSEQEGRLRIVVTYRAWRRV
jgi:hypothetical protein